VAELAKLQDTATPFPFEAVRETIRDELGEDPEQAFSAFDEVPLASASIGQAHAAEIDRGRGRREGPSSGCGRGRHAGPGLRSRGGRTLR